MASIAQRYTDEIKRAFGYNAAWLPGDMLQLGAIGEVQNGVFVPQDHVSQMLGINLVPDVTAGPYSNSLDAGAPNCSSAATNRGQPEAHPPSRTRFGGTPGERTHPMWKSRFTWPLQEVHPVPQARVRRAQHRSRSRARWWRCAVRPALYSSRSRARQSRSGSGISRA